MPSFTLQSLARIMKKLDICMMSTLGKAGNINSRPMSNNKDVTYKGDSYFFTYERSAKVKELENNPTVTLNFEGPKQLYIMISGKAKLIRDKQVFIEHWNESLDQWFKDGVDTKGIVLIHVKGNKIRYWQNQYDGEIKISRK